MQLQASAYGLPVLLQQAAVSWKQRQQTARMRSHHDESGAAPALFRATSCPPSLPHRATSCNEPCVHVWVAWHP
jgi:hypothetical protein